MINYPQLIRKIIPPLSGELHKGQSGIVSIIGGSVDYTGAPYFSAISALKTGVDLVHVICELTAAQVIKTYSPDLMVHPLLRVMESKETISSSNCEIEFIVNRIKEEIFPRTHVLIIGPGLSRDEKILETIRRIILSAREKGIFLVLDADVLFLIQRHPDLVRGYTKAILTPNINEFKRLCESFKMDINSQGDMYNATKNLAIAFGGLTIVQKGKYDNISNGKTSLIINELGGLKRCGGQGDVLSGVIGAFLAFGHNYLLKVWDHDNKIPEYEIPISAAFAGCCLVKDASKRTYEQFGRSMQTSDLLVYIGPTFKDLFEIPNKGGKLK